MADGVYALEEGARYSPCETQVVLEGWADDVIHLETLYLSVLSHAATFVNDGIDVPDFETAKNALSKLLRQWMNQSTAPADFILWCKALSLAR